MEKLAKLMTQLADVDGKIDALLANDELSEDQRKEHDKLLAERTKTLASIATAKASMARAEERRHLDDEAAKLKLADEKAKRTVPASVGRMTDTDAPNQGRQPTATGNQHLDAHGRVVGSFEETDERITLNFTNDPNAMRRQSYAETRRQNAQYLKSCGYQRWGEFKSASDFVRSGLKGHQNSDFRDRAVKHYASVTGMSEGVGSDGGYLVMPEFSSRIIDRVYTNDLWSRTDNYTVAGNSMTFMANAETSRANGSRHGGLRGYWLGEGATKTPTKPTFRQVTLKLVKLAVVVYLTDELLEDTGTVLSDYVVRKASEEFNFMIGDALVNGTGVGQPLGILNAPSLVSVAKESGQAAATLQTENIVKMFSRFYSPNRGNMLWLHNQDVEPQLFTMTLGIGAAGIATYMPPGGLSSAPYATLMGRPSLPTEFNPTLGTQGDIIAADMGQMLSISKGGIAQAVSIHVEFLTDQTALRFVMRLNAAPWETSPLTPYKGPSNTVSNFVTLDTRA